MTEAKKPGPTATWRRAARIVGLTAAAAVGALAIMVGVGLYWADRWISAIDMPLLFSAINKTDRPPPDLAADASAPSPAGSKTDGALTAEEARAALARMVSPNEARLVEAAEGRNWGNGEVSFGPWQCDLISNTFHATFELPRSTLMFDGAFAKDASGVWRATITNRLNALHAYRDH